jgi:glycosyltransferase involved in cell wall biosynthesis
MLTSATSTNCARNLFASALTSTAGKQGQRILMTADTTKQTWTYSLTLSRALIAAGHEVVLASTGKLPDRHQRREAAAVSGLALYSSAYRISWSDDCWGDLRAAGHWLLNLSAAVGPSVVHLNDFGHADLPWNAPVVQVVHDCIASRWRAVNGSPPPACLRRYLLSAAGSLRAANRVVTHSRAMQRALYRHYGPMSAVRVIPNGHEPVNLQARSKGQFILSAGCVGDGAGNIATLLRAAARVTWPVRVAGSGTNPDISGAGLQDVCMLGEMHRAHVRAWLARAPIFALPTRYEPSGHALLEAAHSRCALVVGDIDSLREEWDGAAVFVDPDDDAGLVCALQRLIANPAERDDYANRAFARARRRTASAMSAAYANVYAELTAQHFGAAAVAARPSLHMRLAT